MFEAVVQQLKAEAVVLQVEREKGRSGECGEMGRKGL
jgi:hypothetical protein